MSSRSSLNHIYRTVWNQSLGAMVAVAEIATSGGRSTGASASASVSTFRGNLGLKALAAGIALAWGTVPFVAMANPAGGVAVVGQATMATSGTNLLVTTQNGAGTNHSAINWQSFSVPQGSTTFFQQPSASSTSINRVVTSTPSQLFGTLGSNGNLVLVNQAGITVGAGAVVDTAGFTASSLQMSDADALAGRLRFGGSNGSGGAVSMAGTVLARSGDVVLIGSSVDTGKDALLQAPNGATILVAGSAVSISSRGLEGINFDVQAAANSAVNLGTLKGDAVGIFAGTLKHSGQIQAQAVQVEGGKVVLKATELAEISGSAKAVGLNDRGGVIHATADKVWLKGTASLDASAAKGGGEVLVGGGWQGKDARVSNATTSLVSEGATIKVDATELGDAGTAVVWADGATRFLGHVSAKGGALGGNGGNVEVSGKGFLDFRGSADLLAPNGKAGTLLLDPATLTIQATSPDINGDSTPGDDLTTLTFTSASAASVITAGAVVTLLGTGSVVLDADSNVSVNAPISYLGSNDRSLTLRSTGFFGTVSTTSGAIAAMGSGKLNVVLSSSGGSVNIGDITTNGGNLTLSAGEGVVFQGAVIAGTGTVSVTAGNTGVNDSIGAGSVRASTLSITSGNTFSFKNTAANQVGALNATVTGFNTEQSSFWNTGAMVLGPITTVGGLDFKSTGGAISQSGAIRTGSGTTTNIDTGNGNVTLNASTTNLFEQLILTSTGAVVIEDSGALNLSVNANPTSLKLKATGALQVSLGFQTTAGDLDIQSDAALTVNSGQSLNADRALILRGLTGLTVSGTNLTASKGNNMLLDSGTGTFTAGGYGGSVTLSGTGGVWRTYSLVGGNDFGMFPDTNLTPSLSAGFKQYGATFGSTPLGTGNGRFYTGTAPALTSAGSLTGTVSKVFDGGLGIGLSGAVFSAIAGGTVDGDSRSGAVAVGGTGTLSDPNVGSGKLVTASGMTATGVTFDSGKPVFGYRVADMTGSIATVTPALAVINLTGSRPYDGTANVDAPIFSLGGVVAGQTLTLTGSGTIADKNVGTNKPVSLGSLTLGNGTGGGLASNYTLTGGAAVATITPVSIGAITGVVVGNKVYDGTATTTVSTASAVLPGVIAGEVVSLGSSAAAFSDKNAGFGKPVTVTGLALGGAGASNYVLASTSIVVPGSIVSKPVTVGAVTAANKVYDGTTTATLSGGTLTGAVPGDSVTLSAPTGSFADKNVGTAKLIAVSGLALSGADATNYNLVTTTATATADITAKAVVAGAFSALNKVYDGTRLATVSGGSLSGTVVGDAVSLGPVAGSFSDKNAGSAKEVTVAGLALTGADAGNYRLGSVTASTSADIATKPLTATGFLASSKVYDGTRAVSLSGGVLSGALAGDSVALSAATGSFADKNVGTAKPVAISGGTLTGADAGNYSLSSTATGVTASITQKAVTVAGLAALNKVYDGTTAASISGGSVGGTVSGDNVTVGATASTFADKNVGTAKVVTVSGLSLSGADAANYSLDATSATLAANIAAKPLSVGAISAASKVYDGSTSALITGGSLSGAVAGDVVSLGTLSGNFASKNAGNSKPVVVSGLALQGADAGNYSLATQGVSAVANITPKPLAVGAIAVADKVYDGSTVAVLSGGSLSGVVPGDSVSLAPAVGSFADKNVGTAKPISVTGLALTGADTGNYSLSLSSVNATATVSPKPLVVSGITAVNKPYDGKTDATIVTTSLVLGGLVAGDQVTTTDIKAAFEDKNAGIGKKVLLTGLGLTGLDARNYTFSTNSFTTANIDVLALAEWKGGATGLWSDPKNWTAVPDGANVLAVAFPSTTTGVTLDAAAGSVSLQSLNLPGSLSVAGGSLRVSGGIATGGYSQDAGSVSSVGAFKVTGAFNQIGGSLAAGSVDVVRPTGDIVVGNITSPTVSLTAQSGAIRESGSIQGAALITKSTAGTLLNAPGNQLSSFTAENIGTGNIELVNKGVLTTGGINNTGGNITVVNTGGVTSLDTGRIIASGPGAKISLIANSPLTIGSAGVSAGGDIELVATNLTSAGNITLNGPIESVAGSVAFTAANDLTQNSSVLAPLGVRAAAGGTLTLGPAATSGSQPVSYQVNSVPVTPPRPPTSTSTTSDLVVALMSIATEPVVDRTVAALEGLASTDKDKDRDRDSSKAAIVSEGQICRP